GEIRDVLLCLGDIGGRGRRRRGLRRRRRARRRRQRRRRLDAMLDPIAEARGFASKIPIALVCERRRGVHQSDKRQRSRQQQSGLGHVTPQPGWKRVMPPISTKRFQIACASTMNLRVAILSQTTNKVFARIVAQRIIAFQRRLAPPLGGWWPRRNSPTVL